MKYDRFARSFEYATCKDTMFFKFDKDVFGTAKAKSLQFKIIWLDKTLGSTWSFRYKSQLGTKDAIQVTGSGDNLWKELTFTLNDAIVDGNGRYGSDCMLVNTDNADDIFNSIEVGIEREVSTGVVTNTMTKDLQVFPNPAGSVINIQTSRPINYVELYDLSGKVVLRKNEPHNSMDIGSLSRGIYFLKTMLDNGLTINKIIKE
jgi:Secretion system C-terminal sorting domain